MLGIFFNQMATVKAVAYPQTPGGGELVEPQVDAQLVPCNLQQDSRPERVEYDSGGRAQYRRGSAAKVRLFLQPSDPAGLAAVLAMKVNDQVQVQSFQPINRIQTIVLDGAAFDMSGQGAVWEVAGKEIR